MLITISRQYGAGGSAVAARVAATLGWRVVDNELVERVAARAGLTPEDVAQREERVSTFIERLARTVVAATPELVVPPDAAGTAATLSEADLVRLTERVVEEVAAEGRVVLVGRAAPAVLARERDAIHVKVVAPATGASVRSSSGSACRPRRRPGSPTRPTGTARAITDSTTTGIGAIRRTITWC